MSLTIRLKPTGTKNRSSWRITVADSRMSRTSRILDEIGSYNPAKNPPEIRLDKERYQTWVQKGATPTKTVESIFKKSK